MFGPTEPWISNGLVISKPVLYSKEGRYGPPNANSAENVRVSSVTVLRCQDTFIEAVRAAIIIRRERDVHKNLEENLYPMKMDATSPESIEQTFPLSGSILNWFQSLSDSYILATSE